MTDAPRGSVILALRGAGVPEDAAAIVRHLAAMLQADIAGLFVEDTDLLRIAALPFSVEIGHASGTARPLDPARVERALRAQSARARAAVEQFARHARLAFTFTVARGRFAERALDAPPGSPVVIPRAAPGARPAAADACVVLALGAPSQVATGLRAARRIAAGEGVRLRILARDPATAREVGATGGADAPSDLTVARAGDSWPATLSTLGRGTRALVLADRPAAHEMTGLLRGVRCTLVLAGD